MAVRTWHVLSLFTGGAGLDLAVRLAVPRARTVCYVEVEAFAAAHLVQKMAEGALDDAPVWSDVRTFDGKPWRGRVDWIIGGFPCTDVSNAGKRAGIDGEHSGLWREYARIVREVRPRFVFVENVGALVGRGLERVLGDLAALGFDAEWLCLRASDVGATHERERLFLLGDSPRDGRQQRRAEPAGCERLDSLDRASVDVADAESDGRAFQWQRGLPDDGDSYVVRDPDGRGGPGIPLFPPGPADSDGWRAILESHPDLAPAIESRVRRVADELATGLERSRTDRLRMLGNGVVPLQASAALVVLARRLGLWECLS